MLTETEVPQVFLQPGAFASIRDVVGQIPAIPIPTGGQVTGTSLTGVGQGLATKVPRGKRAVSVAVTDVSGVSGLIRPNNFVDILAIVKAEGSPGSSGQSTFVVSVFQNVLVLAVGDDIGNVQATDLSPSDQEALDMMTNRQSERVRSVTVALAPQQVQDLILAQEVGDLTLSLRSYLEKDVSVDLARSTAANVLGVERVVPRQQPSWMEIRGDTGR
jgi:pilus assembly protein CpaB